MRVKTLYGKRPIHSFEVNVVDKLDRIVQMLNEKDPDEMRSYHDCRLIHPMGALKSLNLDKTFAEQRVPHECQLVLLGTKTFTWDLLKKGSQI